MTTTQQTIAAEALSRAQNGQSVGNYAAILRGFIEKGIPEAEIRPRENVLTYHAWQALGRQVRKGEHGVRVMTYLTTAEENDEAGIITRQAGSRPWSATVFHISQTDERRA